MKRLSKSAVRRGATARMLYLYFRNTDIPSTTVWQPGASENWLDTVFHNPRETGQTLHRCGRALRAA